jgi:hypothetical protein
VPAEVANQHVWTGAAHVFGENRRDAARRRVNVGVEQAERYGVATTARARAIARPLPIGAARTSTPSWRAIDLERSVDVPSTSHYTVGAVSGGKRLPERSRDGRLLVASDHREGNRRLPLAGCSPARQTGRAGYQCFVRCRLFVVSWWVVWEVVEVDGLLACLAAAGPALEERL